MRHIWLFCSVTMYRKLYAMLLNPFEFNCIIYGMFPTYADHHTEKTFWSSFPHSRNITAFLKQRKKRTTVYLNIFKFYQNV